MIKRSFGRDIVWRAREFQARINICLKTCTFKYFVLFLPTDKYIYYGTDSTKRGRIIQVEADLLATLRERAKASNRSLNNFVESVLLDAIYNEPNEETLAAMEEIHSGKQLEKFTSVNALMDALKK